MIGVSFSFKAAKGELESGLAFLDVDMGGQAVDPLRNASSPIPATGVAFGCFLELARSGPPGLAARLG